MVLNYLSGVSLNKYNQFLLLKNLKYLEKSYIILGLFFFKLNKYLLLCQLLLMTQGSDSCTFKSFAFFAF